MTRPGQLGILSSSFVVKSAILGLIFNIIFVVVLLAISLSVLLEPHDNHSEDEKDLQVIKDLHLPEEDNNDLPQIQQEIADIYREEDPQKPALHVEIAPDFSSTDKEAVLTWHNCSNECYDSNDIEYSAGFFTIKVEGYYYIFSTIRYSGSGTEELDYGRIVHRIEKADEQTSESKKRTPITLMQNFKSTPVIRRGRLAYTTSSLAGTFFLPERSKVTVYSSIPDNIDKSPRGTIFGLFLM